MECIEDAGLSEQIMTQLRLTYLNEIINFGHDAFKQLMRENEDRRILFALIKREITFDQYVTRVMCETKDVEYFCKDDLLAKGVSPYYFEN